MNNSQMVNKDNDSKKIFTMLIMIFALMICTTSATYAYFAISATAVNNVVGTAATASMSFTAGPTLVYPASGTTTINSKSYTFSTTPLVPQKSVNGSTNVLQLAVTGGNPLGYSTKIPCVDDNGNAICRVYSFTVKNASTATVDVTGTISFSVVNGTGNKFTNLKWHLMQTKDTTNNVLAADQIKSVGTIYDTVSNTSDEATRTSAAQVLGTKDNWAPNGELTYYIVVWIEETGAAQNDTDKGTFYATISFTTSNGTGITSTITG